jgi:hypothetical protein
MLTLGVPDAARMLAAGHHGGDLMHTGACGKRCGRGIAQLLLMVTMLPRYCRSGSFKRYLRRKIRRRRQKR